MVPDWLPGDWICEKDGHTVGLYVVRCAGRLMGSEVFINAKTHGISHQELFEIRTADGV